MKKIFAIILFGLVFQSFGISSFTYYWTISLSGDTATVTKWKANNDSVLAFATRVTDTLNKGVPRWKGFSNHDSTFKWMNIDTIPSADTIYCKNIKVDKLDSIFTVAINATRHYGTVGTFDSLKGLAVIRGNPDFDSIFGLNVLRGNPDIDSISGLNVLRGNPDIDSISGNPWIDTVTADSIYSRKAKHNAATIGYMIVDTLTADTVRCQKLIDSSFLWGYFDVTIPSGVPMTIFYKRDIKALTPVKIVKTTLLWSDVSGLTSNTSHASTDSIPALIRPQANRVIGPIEYGNASVLGDVRITTAGIIEFTSLSNTTAIDARAIEYVE